MAKKNISPAEFLRLPPGEVAAYLEGQGPQVCAFPLNGSRRWFAIEHWDERRDYVSIAAREYIRLFQLFLDHGIRTILSPLFGSELLGRGDEYVAETLGSLALLESPEFLVFYDQMGARVHFYGNFATALQEAGLSDLIGVTQRITERTKGNQNLRLFFGLFANDATEAIARYSIEFFQRTNSVPGRKELVEAYYGEYIEPVTLFIGFDKPSVFDYPLLSLGEEDLYFTFSPSPYLDERSLRIILYDHLFTRRAEEPDWFAMKEADREHFRKYYRDRQSATLGTGSLDRNVWVPSETKSHVT